MKTSLPGLSHPHRRQLGAAEINPGAGGNAASFFLSSAGLMAANLSPLDFYL